MHELAAHLERVSPTVLTTPDAPPIGPNVVHDRIYPSRGAFAPTLRNNARVLGRLLFGHKADLWHFVFAPNPASSSAARLAKGVRGVPTVQTVASRPRDFEGCATLMFGDRIIALSRFTADQLVRQGVPAFRIQVIPPPVRDLARSHQQIQQARAAAGVPEGAPLFVYAGDLEVSTGAQTFARAIPAIVRKLDGAIAVFACRTKTKRSLAARAQILSQLTDHAARVRFVGEIDDLPSLLASATAAPFPIDNLFAKVDLPYALLETCLLEVPVVVATGGPLQEITGAPAVAPGDAHALAEVCIQLASDAGARRSFGASLRAHVLAHHDPNGVARAHEAIYSELVR